MDESFNATGSNILIIKNILDNSDRKFRERLIQNQISVCHRKVLNAEVEISNEILEQSKRFILTTSTSKIHHLCHLGNEEEIRKLLSSGADVDAKDDVSDCQLMAIAVFDHFHRQHGRTDLHIVVSKGDTYLTRILCREFCANPNLPTTLVSNHNAIRLV